MCPFKKAVPLAIFLHLLMAGGIVAAYAGGERRVFTLIPAQGSGEERRVGDQPLKVMRCPLRPLLEVFEPKAEKTSKPAPPTPQSPKLEPKPQAEPVDSAAGVGANIKEVAQVIAKELQQAAGELVGDSSAKASSDGAAIATELVGGAIVPPVALKKPKPLRPAGSPKGEVVVVFTISTSGEVVEPQVVKSPSPEMAQAVMKVLPRWKFAPAKDGATEKVMSLRVRQVVEF